MSKSTTPTPAAKRAASWSAESQSKAFAQLTANYDAASSRDGIDAARWSRFDSMVANLSARGVIVAAFMSHLPKGQAKNANSLWSNIGFDAGVSPVAIGAEARRERFGSVNSLTKCHDMSLMDTAVRREAFALDNSPNASIYDTWLKIVVRGATPLAANGHEAVMVDGKHATHKGVKRYKVGKAGLTVREETDKAKAKRLEAERIDAVAKRAASMPAFVSDIMSMDVAAVLADPGFALDSIPVERRAVIARGLAAWCMSQAVETVDAPADEALANL